jgi:hypothetical protein
MTTGPSAWPSTSVAGASPSSIRALRVRAAQLLADLTIPIVSPHNHHMAPSKSAGDEAAVRTFAKLAEQARLARQHYDELLVSDPGASDEELELARVVAVEAEKARDRAAAALKSQAPGAPGRDRAQTGSPRQAAGTAGRAGQREYVAEVLGVLGSPVRTTELVLAMRQLFARPLSTAQLTQLRREEIRLYDRAHGGTGAVPRPWYVVPCLSADTLAATPGTYALSTWPLADRLVTPYAPQMWTTRAATSFATFLRNAGREPPPGVTHGPGLLVADRSGLESAPEGGYALLRVLLRGTSGGRHPATVQLGDIVPTLEHDCAKLHERHLHACDDAVTRMQTLILRDPRVALWGLPRPAAAEGSDSG